MTAAGSDPERPSRQPGLDGFKGLAIFSVVVIHAGIPLESGPYRDHVIGGIARLAVPVFLFITGYLSGILNTPRDRLATYLVKFLKLHVIYGAFYWGVSIAMQAPPEAITAKEIARHFAEASYPGQYYFVILIQLFFLTGLVLRPSFWRSQAGWIGGAVAVVAGLALRQAAEASPIVRDLPAALRQPLVSHSMIWFWFYYFALGAFLAGPAGDRLRALPQAGAWLLVAAGCGVAWWGVPLPGDDADPKWLSYLRPRIYVGATLLMSAIPALASRRFGLLEKLGRDSFGVFVLNPAALILVVLAIGPATKPAVSLAHAVLAVALAWPAAIALRKWAPFLTA